MNIDIRDLITLSDEKEYVVVSKVNYQNINYYYIVEIKNINNLKFLYEDKGELVEIDNEELLKTLLPLFYKASRNIIKEMLKEQKENE